MGQKSCNRPWRKFVKKLQRKRRRQNSARRKERELEEAELEKLKDPLYNSWLVEQSSNERQQQMLEENKRREQECLWLMREELAQEQFQNNELKRQADEAKVEAERLKQDEQLRILEEARQKKCKEFRLEKEKAEKDFNDIMKCMQEYLENDTMKTPSRLEYIIESKPGIKICDIFDKTSCCGYDSRCSFNHKRPILSKIIIIKHFFKHPLLEQQEHQEYLKSDSSLELSESDLRESYDEFCEDVWPVLEEFGEINNFRTVRNIQSHFRGNVFVEYVEKRSALKAFINLQNRYYASKRLNVQFSNIRHWYKAVCGLSLGRKCPKGVKCTFMHLLKNRDNKYDKYINNPERTLRNTCKHTTQILESPVMSWDSSEISENKNDKSRNWRWSESPEIELKIQQNTEKCSMPTLSKRKSVDKRLTSNSQQYNSRSPNLNGRKYSQYLRSKSPCLHYHENKRKKYAKEKLEDFKGNCNSKAQRGNTFSHRKSSTKRSRHDKTAKKSREKSPVVAKEQSTNKTKKMC